MTWLTIIVQLFQLLPGLLAMIKQVETIVGPGNGGVKKAIVMAPLTATPATPANLVAAVSTLVDKVVEQTKLLAPAVDAIAAMPDPAATAAPAVVSTGGMSVGNVLVRT